MGGFWSWVWALAGRREISEIEIEMAIEVAATKEREGLFIGAGSVS
jgi:hypothetical protein